MSRKGFAYWPALRIVRPELAQTLEDRRHRQWLLPWAMNRPPPPHRPKFSRRSGKGLPDG